MRILCVAGLTWSVLALVQCTPRNFNAVSEVQGTGDRSLMEASPTPRPDKVPFNAYLLWRDGKGSPILDYPADYNVAGGRIAADGVFYVHPKTYFQDEKYTASVTDGAKVEGDLLIYPTREGRTLALKFSGSSEKAMKHAKAVQYCNEMGLRLPHVQELLDYCAAGETKDSNGGYRNNRCQKEIWWSASVYSRGRSGAWQFNGDVGVLFYYGDRNGSGFVRCVGGV
jgi:hypothetical protein